MNHLPYLPIALLLASLPPAHAAEASPGTTILLRHTEGAQTTDYRYTLNPETARLERLGEPTRPPTPWHLIDRQTGAVTILRPHNQSITTLASDAFERKTQPGPGAALDLPPGVELPPGIGAAPAVPGTPAFPGAGISPLGPQAPARIGPDPAMLPGGVHHHEAPEIPNPPTAHNITQGMPAGIPGGGIPGGIPGGMPPMGLGALPGMDGMDGAPIGELTAHEEIREIHGHSCQRHTLMLDRSLELELWLAQSPDLPPFYLLIWEGPQPFGHSDLLQDWSHLIRQTGKFPLLATLRHKEPQHHPGFELVEEDREPAHESPELARWEILSIDPATPDTQLFEKPENYFSADRHE